MEEMDIAFQYVAAIIGGLSGVATVAAFFVLIRKDKDKQEQLDRLTAIASSLEKQNQLNQRRFLFSIIPEFTIVGSLASGIPRLSNVGDSAVITDIEIEPRHARIVALLPQKVLRNQDVLFDISNQTDETHPFNLTFVIHYVDKVGTEYQCRVRGNTMQYTPFNP
jgi:hypothetical protein